ncbi:MAG TPA: ATPase, T2SS/T4P/T4SS family [Polyangiaceae bacterium]|jgi:type IV pilus assembly protein PilB|nr:ATPase, T2SS/T4P/T4SS family [Polyangiaceae bacterium]
MAGDLVSGKAAAQAVQPSGAQIRLLTQSPLFAGLPPAVVAQLAGRLGRYSLRPGIDVLRFAEGPAGLFVIESGRLAAVVRGGHGATMQVLQTHGSPDAIGAAALVLGGGADVEYVVLDPSVVYLLPRDVFDAVFRQVPEFALAVSKSIAGEAQSFTRHGAIPWVDLDAYSFDEHLWACLPASLTARACVCPLDFSGDAMTVAMVDPREVAALDALSEAVPGVRFRVVACSAEDLSRFIGTRAHSHPGKAGSSSPPSLSADERASFRFLSDDGMATRELRGKPSSLPPPAVSAIEEIVGVGLTSGASDIHIEPERQGVTVRYRIDGALHRRPEPIAADLAKAIAIRLKTLARVDITETRKPQDGRISVGLSSGRLVDLRLSTVPAKFGEKIALRVLDSEEAITDLKTLFVVEEVRTLFARVLSRKTGFLLVTGPTGSGKSTTLYSALNACRAHHVNIMTVEDPIEYHLDGVTQVEVHPETGTTFAMVLRALLRQDPNIILVGEMRDAETARIAVEASLTGHLVMSSLHTSGTLQAIARMRDMGIEPYALANGLLAVLHQRLVQRTCPHCVTPFEYPPFVIDTLVRHGVLPAGQPPILMRGTGCARCRNTGLLGRMAVCGVLVVNDELRDAIGRRASLAELRAAAGRGAHVELSQYAGALLRMGVTVPGEIIPLLQHAED